jgi:hypothetical protein
MFENLTDRIQALHGPNRREQKKDNSNECDIPDERAEQGNTRGVQEKVDHPGRKIEAGSPFAQGTLAAKHVNKEDRSHKHRKRLKEVSKCSFKATC